MRRDYVVKGLCWHDRGQDGLLIASLSGGRIFISVTGGRGSDTLTHQGSVLPLHKPQTVIALRSSPYPSLTHKMATSPLPSMMAITGYFNYNFTSTSARSIIGHVKSSVAEDENTTLPCRQINFLLSPPQSREPLSSDFASECIGVYPGTLVHSATHLYFAGLWIYHQQSHSSL